jgi:hypothetical protein
MDCFAEPVIGRRFAPTRWLAMTSKHPQSVAQFARFFSPTPDAFAKRHPYLLFNNTNAE